MIDVTGRPLLISLLFIAVLLAVSPGFSAPLQRMRPYTGIGLVVFFQSDNTPHEDLQLHLYEEPGLSRTGTLNSSWLPGNEWIFGLPEGAAPLIVSARRGDWLRVYYDDAGREAWIDPMAKGRFLSWEQFLKQRVGRMLPGLQSQYYQLQQKPGGKLLATLTPKQLFKVLKIENAWSMVLINQTQIGWLRWHDEDGRLLVGFSP